MRRLVSQSAFLAFSLTLMVSSIFGQSFFNPAPPPPPPETSTPSNQPMTPEEFKNKVKALEQETTTRTAQEVSQQIPRKAGPAPVATPTQETTTTVTTTTSTTPTPPEPVAQTTTPTTDALPPSSPPPPTASVPPTSPAPKVTQSITDRPPPIPPPPPESSAATQSDFYTGFSSPDTKTKPSSAPSAPGAPANTPQPWNIKY